MGNKETNFFIFKSDTGKANIDVYFQDKTFWLLQKLNAELFEKGRPTITEYLKKIFEDGELDENSVCRKSRHIAFGYSVNSQKAIEYRNISN
jgi:hypothetical protein